MVPLLGAIVLSYGLLAEPAPVIADMHNLTSVMRPADGAKLIGDQLMNVMKTSADKKGAGLLLALAIALDGVQEGPPRSSPDSILPTRRNGAAS